MIKRIISKDEKMGSDWLGGLVFVGCMFLGIGLGMLVDNMQAGTIIGMGVGFLAMAVLGRRNR